MQSRSTRMALGLALFATSMVKSAYAEAPGAEPSLADRSTGTQLFNEGRALLAHGHVAEACRKLEESQRIDPGGGTLLNVALCHEREGRTSSAWVEFTEALGIAKRDGRAQRVDFALTHLAQLEPLLSRLAIEVPAVADLPGLEIKRDGNVVGRAAWGSRIPLDPGEHVVEAAAPGKVSWTQVVVLTPKSDNKKVVVPVLESAASGAVGASVVPKPAVTRSAPSSNTSVARKPPNEPLPVPESQGPPGRSNAPAWISLGVGALATGAGAYFGIRALHKKSEADRSCRGSCSAAGVTENDDAIRSANLSSVGFGVGALGLGLGALLLLTRTPASRATDTPAQSSATRLAVSVDGSSFSRHGLGVEMSSSW